jgi:hypothetical protein
VVYAVRATVGAAVAVCVAIAVLREFGCVVLLGGEEVASQGVGELKVGSECARLSNDGGAARDNVPKYCSRSVSKQPAILAESGDRYPVERINFVMADMFLLEKAPRITLSTASSQCAKS